MDETNDLRQQRLEKLNALRAEGADPFQVTKFHRTHSAAEIANRFAQLEGQSVRLAGRMKAKRGMGKASFIDIHDQSGRIQVYARLDVLGEAGFAAFGNCDVGDILGVTGKVFKTRRGEVSVEATEVQLLAKSLLPLPEKWHGLTDVEQRYRQRYVDLIANDEVKQAFQLRFRMVAAIRRFLEERGFYEVETPMLQALAGGATARPFITHHNALDLDLYLRIAPELHLKRLVVGGFEKVYELNRNFRNEGLSTRHNPEFSMLEFYQAYADYHEVMEVTEHLIAYAAEQATGSLSLEYHGHHLDLTPPWPRVPLYDAVAQYGGLDFHQLQGDDEARAAAAELGLKVEDHWGLAHVVDETLKKVAIPKLIQPTFLIDYPVELSPLAKRKPEAPHLTERFQCFMGGLELGNGFSELNDPLDQAERFRMQAEQSKRGDEEAHPWDHDYVRALEYGLPPTGGVGIGIDRLAILLTNADSIRDVILFPLLRPEG